MSRLQRHMSQTIRALRSGWRCQCGEGACATRGLSQAELAKAIGVPTNTVSRWETGTYWPKVYDIQNLADYFSVSVAVFFLPMPDRARAGAREEVNGPDPYGIRQHV